MVKTGQMRCCQGVKKLGRHVMAFHKVFFFATRFGNLKKTLNFISVCRTIYWVKQMQPAELIMLALILLMGALQARLAMAAS